MRRALPVALLASLLVCVGCTGLLVYEGSLCALGIVDEAIKPEIRQYRIELDATPDLDAKLQQCFDVLSAEFAWTLRSAPMRDPAGLRIEADHQDTTSGGGFRIWVETIRHPASISLYSAADASEFRVIDRACGRFLFELNRRNVPWRIAWCRTKDPRGVLGP